ncbi:MAG: energy transducer TonB [Candidatus Eisenbacteria bacterium]|uniref:Energy transducer TonB n=1 Tax=Eiseniibacteriota bacterium TaxID=2212470 RepID=A0A538SDI5_UNCEI|nr:MAG: energy transducer TonB [Candidatus Eisenbacteria bacterium]TMQ60739.1 MAG: energy transducer TonB [Candidatus Eisenbacteria bacterium]
MSAQALDASGREQGRYYRRMEAAFLLAMGIHAAVLLLAPAYVPRPYTLPATPLRLVAAGPARAGGGRAHAGALAPTPATTTRQTRSIAAPVIRRGTPILTEQLHPASPVAAGGPSNGTARGGGGGAAGGEGETGLDGPGEEAPPLFYAFDAPPKVLDRVIPDYPAHVKAAGGQGSVVLNANVDERGHVIRVWVAQATAPDALVEAAVDALYRFQFAPGSQQGVPVKCTVAVPFNFSLNVHL